MEELNSASIKFRVLPTKPGTAMPVGNCYDKATFVLDSLGTTPPWIEMQKVGFDDLDYYLFLSGTAELPSNSSSLEFLVVHSSFEQVWYLPLPVTS